jgi:transaldolase
MSDSRLHQVARLGQSIWIDSISRQWLQDGTLDKLIREDAVVGVTSNPTIFEKAISSGSAYDEQMRELVERGLDAKAIFYELAVQDIRDALDVLRPAYEASDGVDGRVSIEVDPDIAYDRDAQYQQAKRFHEWIDRPNLYVKIPGTKPGLGAIEDSIAEGRSINVTLIFSLERHREVMEAYLRGIERLVEAGGDPKRTTSVASFFVSRVDTEADKRLEAIGTPEALALRGKLAVANAKIAYQNYKEVFSGERWESVRAKGARVQRCLWASTSTKNPEYRDVLYVEELIGPETVNTMPLETIEAFQEHGVVAETLEQGLDEARRLFEDLEQVGVDYDDVVETLEREGVEKFSDSFDQLLGGVRSKRGELVSA